MIRVALLLAIFALPVAAEPGMLEVSVTGVRNARGHVLVAVCTRDSFLAPTCALRGRAVAVAGAVGVRVAVPPGVYAVEAYHDENDNNQLDRSFFGLPTEGMGFSRDAPMRMGPPRFDDAAVTVTAGGGTLSLALRYFD